MQNRDTLFHRWRRRMGLTQMAAADRLGYSIRRIRAFDNGEETPPLRTLVAMQAIRHNLPPYSLEDAA
ncbi:MAG TPA: helix-turn-helix transcriptional regulator [Ramlibacter sp.]|nr:helix-turn-helix transcriptional regulator [Ramlibacter sp.]